MKLKKTSAKLYFKAIALALAIFMICPIAMPVAAEAIDALAEANDFSVSSPDGRIEIALSNSENGLLYTVTKGGRTGPSPTGTGQ